MYISTYGLSKNITRNSYDVHNYIWIIEEQQWDKKLSQYIGRA